MTNNQIKGMEAGFNFLEMVFFKILMITDGRTTDILETLMDESMSLQVMRQEQIDDEHTLQLGKAGGAPYYVRESVLIGGNSGLVLSHNVALVCSKFVPPVMFEAIASKQEGIGKTISTLGLQTSRKIIDYGWINENETVDLFHNPMKLRFSTTIRKAPYKIYSIQFGQHTGIYLLEYYNPDMVAYRVKQMLNEMNRG